MITFSNVSKVWEVKLLNFCSLDEWHTHLESVLLGNCSTISQKSVPLKAFKPSPFELCHHKIEQKQ